MADGLALGGILLDAAEVFGDALADRLERLVPGAVQGGPPLSPDSVRFADGALRCCALDAHALGRSMVDGDEDRDLAVLHREGGGHLGAPHRVDRLGDDGVVMVARAAGAAHAGGCLQTILPHQAAHPLL